MKIEHLSLWVKDLEKMKDFYVNYFAMSCSKRYTNKRKHFSSYFLSFPEGARIELMHRPDIKSKIEDRGNEHGLTHFAISAGSIEQVDLLTELLRSEGFSIIGEPRTTGDGYYESVILDPEGNQVEITE